MEWEVGRDKEEEAVDERGSRGQKQENRAMQDVF